jgi:hypothetical protein
LYLAGQHKRFQDQLGKNNKAKLTTLKYFG